MLHLSNVRVHSPSSGCSRAHAKPFRSSRKNNCKVVNATEPGKAPSTKTREEPGAALKAVWYGAEVFGKLVGMGKEAPGGASASGTGQARMTREELVASLREDYSTNYFVSGKGDMSAYAEDCEFSDPFVAFKGTSRFKQNVGNLGGMMQDIKLDVYDWKEEEQQVVTRWRFSCVLDLPWKPLLAAAGGTTHVIDPDAAKVVRHIEAWDVEPKKVVAQLFRPSAKIPMTFAETFMMSVSDGDVKGVWFALSPLALKLSLPVVVASVACKLITGEGFPGFTLGALEGVSYLALVSAVVTEILKLTGY